MQITSFRFRLIQIFLELAIPVFGMIFWDWTLYFILLFYLLDYLTYHVLVFFKDRKIQYYTEGAYCFPVRHFAGAVLSVGVNLLLYYLFLNQLGIRFKEDTLRFLLLKDMGIAQGYLLIPLIILTAVMQYKSEFIRMGLFTHIKPATLWKENYIVDIWVLCGGMLLLFCTLVLHLPEQLYSYIFLSGLLLFKLFSIKTKSAIN